MFPGPAYNRDTMMPTEEVLAVLAHTGWKNAPVETDQRYFRTWQRVSLALQRSLKTWIPEMYFQDDLARYEDRDRGYQLVVYEACRVFYGQPRTEFTYDVADPGTLPAALRTIGRSMQTVLGRIATRLHQGGRLELGRRYAPVWHKDILRAVRKKPRHLVGLLAGEANLIDAVIDLGTERNFASAARFSRAATAALRAVYGMDMRLLDAKVLQETTRVLAGQSDATHRIENLFDSGILENRDAGAAGRPDARIA
jgi:hypothetical protein